MALARALSTHPPLPPFKLNLPLLFPTYKQFFSSTTPLKRHFPKPKPSKHKQNHKTPTAVITASSKTKTKTKTKDYPSLENVKKRTRSEKSFDDSLIKKFGDKKSHIPVLLGEVLDVFSPPFSLLSFVDCTVGAAGHSSAIIQSHPEMQSYIGMDVDPVAHEKAKSRIDTLLQDSARPSLKAHLLLKNFKEFKQAICQADDELLTPGVDGILMDLGMSSMQVDDAGRGFSMLNEGPLDMRMDPMASLKAEDILNLWPADEIGRILRDYGEESKWYVLQEKIVKARGAGGLHTTNDLVSVIRSMSSRAKGGRQGWIKTAARVFQALRIAVNDELKTLEQSLHSCYECLSPGGRLAVISFHSLEDRIVKQTFLNIINGDRKKGETGDQKKGETGDSEDEDIEYETELMYIRNDGFEKEVWIKSAVKGSNGIILTKRPITASAGEEKLNPRCRSAKLRVIQKL